MKGTIHFIIDHAQTIKHEINILVEPQDTICVLSKTGQCSPKQN
jgi:hypothetical protein